MVTLILDRSLTLPYFTPLTASILPRPTTMQDLCRLVRLGAIRSLRHWFPTLSEEHQTWTLHLGYTYWHTEIVNLCLTLRPDLNDELRKRDSFNLLLGIQQGLFRGSKHLVRLSTDRSRDKLYGIANECMDNLVEMVCRGWQNPEKRPCCELIIDRLRPEWIYKNPQNLLLASRYGVMKICMKFSYLPEQTRVRSVFDEAITLADRYGHKGLAAYLRGFDTKEDHDCIVYVDRLWPLWRDKIFENLVMGDRYLIEAVRRRNPRLIVTLLNTPIDPTTLRTALKIWCHDEGYEWDGDSLEKEDDEIIQALLKNLRHSLGAR